MTIPRPTTQEYAPFYQGYIDQVPGEGDLLQLLMQQQAEVTAQLSHLSDEKAGYRYAPGKWSVRELVGHLIDAERVMTYRLLRISRADETPLAGFDENDYVATANFEQLSLRDLLAEWEAVRHSTVLMLKNLSPATWEKTGTANGKTVSVRALIYIIYGHTRHHLNILRERYGLE